MEDRFKTWSSIPVREDESELPCDDPEDGVELNFDFEVEQYEELPDLGLPEMNAFEQCRWLNMYMMDHDIMANLWWDPGDRPGAWSFFLIIYDPEDGTHLVERSYHNRPYNFDLIRALQDVIPFHGILN